MTDADHPSTLEGCDSLRESQWIPDESGNTARRETP